MEKKKRKIQHPISLGISIFWSVMTIIPIIMASMEYHSPTFVSYSEMDLVALKPECDYGDCSNTATTLIYTNGAVPNNVWPNKNYRLSGTSYDKIETYLAPKKDTYLVPDEKGFKVETERGWEEKTYTDGSYTHTSISGYYCAEHKDMGKNLMQNGVKYAQIRTKVFSYFFKVILVAFPWLWMLIKNMRAKRKAAKAQKSSTNSKT